MRISLLSTPPQNNRITAKPPIICHPPLNFSLSCQTSLLETWWWWMSNPILLAPCLSSSPALAIAIPIETKQSILIETLLPNHGKTWRHHFVGDNCTLPKIQSQSSKNRYRAEVAAKIPWFMLASSRPAADALIHASMQLPLHPIP